jgi:hypothetical protein
MRWISLSYLLVLLLVNNLQGQVFSFSLAYQNNPIPEWNKAIQTYNFTRPFLSNRQPLLTHGLQAEAAYYFKSDRGIVHGVHLAYAGQSSVAENVNLRAALHFHLVQPGYFRQVNFKGRAQGWMGQASASLLLGGIFRAINDEALVYDDATAKAWGVGGRIQAQLGYQFSGTDNLAWQPFVGISYVPYYYAPQAEAILNQTTGLTSKNWTTMESAQIGVRILVWGK